MLRLYVFCWTVAMVASCFGAWPTVAFVTGGLFLAVLELAFEGKLVLK
jgi:hypothetical protein